jgi:hypothetical protein
MEEKISMAVWNRKTKEQHCKYLSFSIFRKKKIGKKRFRRHLGL